MTKKPKISIADAVTSAATDFINSAPDAPVQRDVRDGSKVHRVSDGGGMVRIAFEVSPDERAKLKILATMRQTTVSELLRRFVQDQLRMSS